MNAKKKNKVANSTVQNEYTPSHRKPPVDP